MSQMAPESGGDQQTYTTVYDVQVQGQQGLNSMLEITNQYAAASDSLLGKVAKLNTGFVGMAKHFTGMKPLNAGAVSEAARYQQMLSGLEATVKVSTKGNNAYHQSFTELRKDTKALARDMPISMTQAIQTVDVLHQGGVKTNRELKSLAKTYTELGKATGEYGPNIAGDMQALNRQYDSNIKQARGYADSLTDVTAKLGGTASGTLQFAKSIAPIASTVGVGETAVLGISNAFSKMGEDGYGAATAVNKVLIDLNRSVRQGTPEMSQYARLLDMSTDSLSKLFKADPAEVVTRFTEAIKKQGPEAITALDELGFDGVRQSRALSAAARGGGLRESIQTAMEGYNSGATKLGAKTATGGLNDEMEKLQETTRQTVEATGRPFLSYLTEIVKLSNAASQGIRGIVDSNAAQKVGQVGAAVGTVGGGLLHVASLGLTAAFARNILRGGVNAFQRARTDFRIGRQAMVATGDASLARASAVNSPMIAGMGARWGEATGEMGKDVGAATPWRARAAQIARAGGEAARRSALGAMGATQVIARSGRFDVEQARSEDGVRPVTAARAAYRTDMETARLQETLTARNAQRLQALGRLMGSGLAQDATLRGAAAATAGEVGRTGYLGTRYALGGATALGKAGFQGAGRMLGAGVGGLAGMVSPMTLGLGAVGGIGYSLYQSKQQTNAMAAEAKSAVADPYAAYNEFAGALGKAGRSASGFADAAEQAANRLANLNPNRGDAYNFTQTEGRAAMAYSGPHALNLSDKEQGKTSFWGRVGHIADAMGTPGNYLKSWRDVFGHGGGNKAAGVDELTAKLSTTLGNQANSDDVSRMLFDLRSQGVSQTDVHKVGRNLQKIYGKDGYGSPGYKLGIGAAISAQNRQNTAQGAGQDTTDYIKATVGGIGQEADRIGSIYDEKSAQVATYGETDKFLSTYSRQRKHTDKRRRGAIDKVVASSLADALGVDAGDVQKHLDAGSINELMSDISEDGSKHSKHGAKVFSKLGLGSSIDMSDILRYAQKPKDEKRERDVGTSLDTSFEAVTGMKAHAKTWDKGMHGVEDQLFDMGKTLETGGKALEAGMDPLQRALYALQTQGPDARRTFLAGQQLSNAQMQRYGGNASMAGLGLAASLGQTKDPRIQDAIKSAQSYLSSVVAPVQQAQMSPVEGLRQRMQAGAAASLDLPKASTSEQQEADKAAIVDAAAAQGQMISMRKQYEMQVIETFRNIEVANKQELLSEQRANEDYNRSRLYAEQDYNRQIARSRRDFARQMAHSDQDFQRQMAHAAQDYAIARGRAEDDYFRGRQRALEDFNRQQTYAIEDHQRQVSNMLKDAGSNMYDPYKRIQAADVMDASGLASNITEQAAMLRKQSANIKRLLELGLSQRTIDALDMYNPANAYQVERLVQDIENDRSQAQQLNLAVGEKDAAAAPLATSSEAFRRSEDEFKIGLDRSADQFKTSMDRMQEDQRIAMDRMAADQIRSVARAVEENRIQRKRAQKEFAIAMEDAAVNQHIALTRMQTAHETALTRARQDLSISTTLMLKSLDIAGQQLTRTAGSVSDAAAAAIASAPLRWIGPLNRAINVMGAALRAGLAGAVPSSLSFAYTATGSTNAQVAEHNITRHALGGIAQKPHVGMIAEAGYPEALIPLNERGASMLHTVMQRYAATDNAGNAYGQSYAQPVQQHQVFTYDYSTNVEHVTVVANDPHEMFRQLENIESTKRLIQPAGN